MSGPAARGIGTRSALRHATYRRYFASQAVSLAGTQMHNLALLWAMLVLTDDAFQVALLGAAQGLPILLLSIPAGIVADRQERRFILIATQSTAMITAVILGLVVLSGAVQAWHLLLVAVVLGCTAAIEMPARQAFVAEMVGADDLASGSGLFSALYSTMRLVGPALAGLVIAALAPPLGGELPATGVVFLVNAASFAAVILTLWRIRAGELFRARPSNPARGLSGSLDGFRLIRHDPRLAATLLVPGAIVVIAVNWGVLVPVFGEEEGLGVAGVGFLLSAIAAGALAANVLIGATGVAGPTTLVAGGALLGLGSLAIGIAPEIALVAPLFFLAAVGGSALRTAASTQLQLATPSSMHGRMMSLFSLIFEGASPLGALLAGAVAEVAGPRAAFVASGAAALAILALGSRLILKLRPPVTGGAV